MARRQSSLDTELEDEDIHTVGVMPSPHISALSRRDSMARTRSIDETPVKCQEFSDLSNLSTITSLCINNIPGWKNLPGGEKAITIVQLLEGLSNQLFKVRISSKEHAHVAGHSCVLFRVYGKEVSKLYDPVDEMKVFKLLGEYRIAPVMIAHGDGWRIEEWHYAVAVPTRALPNPSIYTQVAGHVARMHKLHKRPDFPNTLTRTPVTDTRLKDWGKQALEIYCNCKDPNMRGRLDDLKLEEIVPNEIKWLLSFLHQGDTGVHAQGLDVVLCHNDVQENNCLQTQYGLRLIDFEYTHFNYQAYDIANFFCEFTMDYVNAKTYPFYTTDVSKYPSKASQRMFAAVYLSEYLEMPIMPEDDTFIQPLLQNVQKFTLVSHLLWALWSVVRAPQAPTYDEFDFIHYADFRLDMYFRFKEKFLANEKKQQAQTMSNNGAGGNERVQATQPPKEAAVSLSVSQETVATPLCATSTTLEDSKDTEYSRNTKSTSSTEQAGGDAVNWKIACAAGAAFGLGLLVSSWMRRGKQLAYISRQ